MKYNLKNRPKMAAQEHGRDCYEYGEVEEWFEGFQKELGEWRCKEGQSPDMIDFLIKEILGENDQT